MRRLLRIAPPVIGIVLVCAGVAAAATPGAKLWSTDYNGPGNAVDAVRATAVSPDGTAVFVAGGSDAGLENYDAVTIAYDPTTGDELWAKRYDGPAGSEDQIAHLAVSPDGSAVFAAGFTSGAYPSPWRDYLTIAYDTTTGDKLWSKRYDGPGSASDTAAGVAVSPDGATIFVIGESAGASGDADFATVAYDAATGAKLWARRYDGPGASSDYGARTAVSPDGSVVVVAGQSTGSVNPDMATVAYDTATGATLWVKRYKGPDNRYDHVSDLAIAPDGSMVYITGGSSDYETQYDIATIAYDLATGAKQWVQRHDGPAHSNDGAYALSVSPDGETAFVSGSIQKDYDSDYATIAYDAATGARLWIRRYNGSGNGADYALGNVVSPDSTRLYVTGASVGSGTDTDYATISYDAATGAKLWIRRYNGSGNGADYARDTALSPDGLTVFVAGEAVGTESGVDIVTIAYGA